MLTLTQHVSCCYSESEMKAEGKGQCAEGGGNCEGQQCLGRMQTVSIRYSCHDTFLCALCCGLIKESQILQ